MDKVSASRAKSSGEIHQDVSGEYGGLCRNGHSWLIVPAQHTGMGCVCQTKGAQGLDVGRGPIKSDLGPSALVAADLFKPEHQIAWLAERRGQAAPRHTSRLQHASALVEATCSGTVHLQWPIHGSFIRTHHAGIMLQVCVCVGGGTAEPIVVFEYRLALGRIIL